VRLLPTDEAEVSPPAAAAPSLTRASWPLVLRRRGRSGAQPLRRTWRVATGQNYCSEGASPALGDDELDGDGEDGVLGAALGVADGDLDAVGVDEVVDDGDTRDLDEDEDDGALGATLGEAEGDLDTTGADGEAGRGDDDVVAHSGGVATTGDAAADTDNDGGCAETCGGEGDLIVESFHRNRKICPTPAHE
jgi:hypothetical protein